MPGKRKNKSSGQKVKSVPRYWVSLLFLGPAVFFIYYILIGGGSGTPSQDRAYIPPQYRVAGEAVSVGQDTLTAAPGGNVIFSRKLVIGNNTIVPEGGNVFAVIPLAAPEGFEEPDSVKWYIDRGDGTKYDLLKTVKNNPAGSDLTEGTEPGSQVFYLVFKVSRQEELYLVYTAPNPPAAWKLPPIKIEEKGATQ